MAAHTVGRESGAASRRRGWAEGKAGVKPSQGTEWGPGEAGRRGLLCAEAGTAAGWGLTRPEKGELACGIQTLRRHLLGSGAERMT